MKIIILSLFVTFNVYADLPHDFSVKSGTEIKAQDFSDSFEHIDKKAHIELNRNTGTTFGTGNNDIYWSIAPHSHKISMSANNLTFTETGLYEITIGLRLPVDLWMSFFMEDSSGANLGQSNAFGGSPSSSTVKFLFSVANIHNTASLVLKVYGSNGYVSSPPAGYGPAIKAVIKKID